MIKINQHHFPAIGFAIRCRSAVDNNPI